VVEELGMRREHHAFALCPQAKAEINVIEIDRKKLLIKPANREVILFPR
jgi:hypothetical protein